MSAEPSIGLPFLDGDALAYTIATIKNCRRRFFPFLWQELSRADLMAVSRSIAWLMLTEDRPQTKRALWNATQRRLYKAATEEGWRRSRRHSMRYDQRLIYAASLSDIPGRSELAEHGSLRQEVVAALLDLLTADELAILGGLVANLTEDEIAAALATSAALIRQRRLTIRRKLRQELERIA